MIERKTLSPIGLGVGDASYRPIRDGHSESQFLGEFIVPAVQAISPIPAHFSYRGLSVYRLLHSLTLFIPFDAFG